MSGYGFSYDIAVTIGTQPCNIIKVELAELRCIVSAVSEELDFPRTFPKIVKFKIIDMLQNF